MAGIPQNGQKCPVFIAVPPIKIADGSGFSLKKDSKIILQIVIIILI